MPLCNFCSVWTFHEGRTRKMSAERVVRELGTIRTKSVTFVDDNFHRLRDYVTAKKIPLTQLTILTPLPGTELYRSRYHELLTHDYACFDALRAVVPTRLPREVFYQHFAALYRQTSLEPYYDLLQSGRVTIEQLRRGKTVLDSMVRWESYVEHDPVLGAHP